MEGYGFSLLVYHPKLGTQEKSSISLAKVFRACLCVTWLKPGLNQVPHLYEVTHVEFTELFRTSLSFRGRARRKGERRILLAFNNQVGLGVVICKLWAIWKAIQRQVKSKCSEPGCPRKGSIQSLGANSGLPVYTSFSLPGSFTSLAFFLPYLLFLFATTSKFIVVDCFPVLDPLGNLACVKGHEILCLLEKQQSLCTYCMPDVISSHSQINPISKLLLISSYSGWGNCHSKREDKLLMVTWPGSSWSRTCPKTTWLQSLWHFCSNSR